MTTPGILKDSREARAVAVVLGAGTARYPAAAGAPFHPSEAYPEFAGVPMASAPNAAYAMVRRVLADLGLDRERFGTPAWNPVGDLVRPGAKVVLKPNWVFHENPSGAGMECLVTHPAILRAALDYVLLAKPGEIVVGDAPLQGCDFRSLMSYGFDAVIGYVKAGGANIRLADFRRTTLDRDGFSLRVHDGVRPLDEYRLVDLGARSLLEPISGGAARFRVTMYDPRKMKDNHRAGLHRYLVAGDVLDADLVFNLPKLKTHKKAGITGSLKNLVGINGNKEYLPHHRKGWPARGGDACEKFSPFRATAEELLDFANRHLARPVLSRELYRLVYGLLVLDMKFGGSGDVEGGWYGNDTVWRMCLDLNRLLLYADKTGRLTDAACRAELSIMDAVIAGQGDGPLKPDPFPMNAVIGSLNPAAADWVSALLMGLDPARIPILSHAFGPGDLPIAPYAPADIRCVLNGIPAEPGRLAGLCGRARPSAGWRGHCEARDASDLREPTEKG